MAPRHRTSVWPCGWTLGRLLALTSLWPLVFFALVGGRFDGVGCRLSAVGCQLAAVGCRLWAGGCPTSNHRSEIMQNKGKHRLESLSPSPGTLSPPPGALSPSPGALSPSPGALSLPPGALGLSGEVEGFKNKSLTLGVWLLRLVCVQACAFLWFFF